MEFKNKNLNLEVINLIGKKGNVRGEILRSSVSYIKYREGEKGLILLEEKLKEIGYPLRLGIFKSLKWYPEFVSVLIIITAKEIFNWSDKDIFDMGNFAPKSSFIVKFLMKYFLSLRKCFSEVPNYWNSHFDFGELEPFDFSEKEKYLIIKVRGYNFHPLMCIYHAGYFLRIAQLNIKSERIDIQELKCLHREDISYHEYKISWL